jgi:hypothetical protein
MNYVRFQTLQDKLFLGKREIEKGRVWGEVILGQV